MNEETKIKRRWSTRRKVLVAFAAVWGAVIVVVAPGLFWELHKATSALHRYGDALIAKDYGRAYSLTSPELRASADYARFLDIHNGLTRRVGDLKEIKVNSSEVKKRDDGWVATVNADMIFARGTLSFVFILKREEGAWKVYSYHEE